MFEALEHCLKAPNNVSGRRAEPLAVEAGLEAAPGVIDPAGAGAAAQQHLEAERVAAERLAGEGVEGRFQTVLQDGRPVRGGEVGVAGGDLLAEAGERLRV